MSKHSGKIGLYLLLIVALIAGAAVLIAVIVVAGKATGLIGGGKANTEADQPLFLVSLNT